MAKLVLASASPRRQELMEMLGFNFTIVPSKIDEEKYNDLDPVEMVKELARAKAEDVAALVEDTVVIGSDTIVVLDDKVLGKPSDQPEARDMLRRLQNRRHSVYTGIAVWDTFSGQVVVDYDKTDVFMSSITDDDILEYVKTGEPMDKAGAYGIQGVGGIFVEKINGSYFTVMGLPIHKLVKVLKEFDISLF